jgi:hypothetical protein
LLSIPFAEGNSSTEVADGQVAMTNYLDAFALGGAGAILLVMLVRRRRCAP